MGGQLFNTLHVYNKPSQPWYFCRRGARWPSRFSSRIVASHRLILSLACVVRERRDKFPNVRIFPYIYTRADRIETRIPINSKNSLLSRLTRWFEWIPFRTSLPLHLTIVYDHRSLPRNDLGDCETRVHTKQRFISLGTRGKYPWNTNRIGMIDSGLTTNLNQCFIHREEGYFSLLFSSVEKVLNSSIYSSSPRLDPFWPVNESHRV